MGKVDARAYGQSGCGRLWAKWMRTAPSGGAAGRGGRPQATGGGAFKFNKLFQDRLGLTLQKEDEMGCVVAGANFLLQARARGVLCGARGVNAWMHGSGCAGLRLGRCTPPC